MKKVLCVVIVFVVLLALSCGSPSQSNQPPGATENGNSSSDTITPDPEPEPSIDSWRNVATFSGGNWDETTDTFYIPGDQFRLNWTAGPRSNALGDIHITVFKQNNTTAGGVNEYDLLDETNGALTIDEGEGYYYLEISETDCSDWEVEVQSYHSDDDEANIPNPPAGSWNSVTTLSYTYDKTCGPITIPADKFRIIWEAVPGDSVWTTAIPAEIKIFVYKEGTSYWEITSTYIYDNWITSSTPTDTSYIHRGSGNYYIKVDQTGCESWQVIIESFH